MVNASYVTGELQQLSQKQDGKPQSYGTRRESTVYRSLGWYIRQTAIDEAEAPNVTWETE